MTALFIIFFAWSGALVGSFVGVLAERLHSGASWISGHSKCNSCARVLAPLDLVPIFSWLIFRGRCRRCSARIPAGYLFLELSMAGLFVLSYLFVPHWLPLFVFLIALTVLAAIVVYDLRHTVVPDELALVLFGASAFFAVLVAPSHETLGIWCLVAGSIAAAFTALHVLSRGRMMGMGDAPVVLSLSLLVGAQAISGLLFSFWIGAVVGIIILVLRRGGPTMGIEVPFVPFLACGFLLAYFTGWSPFPSILF